MADHAMTAMNCPPASGSAATGESRQALDKKMDRIGRLVADLENCGDESVRHAAGELVETLMEIHREALTQIVTRVIDEKIVKELGDDPVTGSVLLMHGLHPVDVESRVNEALDKVRPMLQTHHGDVELVELTGGLLRLKLKGTCHGCPSSQTTFKNLIEGAVYGMAPEVEFIDIEGLAPVRGVES